jgi:hypothetical protein
LPSWVCCRDSIRVSLRRSPDRSASSTKKKAPPFGGAFLTYQSKLTVLTGIGSLPLTARVLLLLAGFLTAALLLTGLLARVLVLLARVLILISH